MGSCCNKHSQMMDIKKPFESGPQSSLKPSDGVKTYTSLTVECPYSHCNVLVWTKSPSEFSELFPQSHDKLLVNSNFEMTFNLTSFYSYSATSPIVIDAFVSFINNNEELNLAKDFQNTHSNICIHIVVSSLKLKNLGKLIQIPDQSQLFIQLFEQQANLEKLLRNIFTGADNSFSDFINFEVLFQKLQRENPQIKIEDVKGIMKHADVNNDGLVSFNEFSYWWKRGRQGKASYLNWTKNWSERINFLLPTMNRFAEKKEIDRSTLKKSIKVELGEFQEPRLSITVKAGKSAKRDEILGKVENLMSLEVAEFWVAVVLTGKSESYAMQNLRIFEDMVYYLEHSLISSSVKASENNESINTNVQVYRNQILFSLSLELADYQKLKILETLDKIQHLLNSPVDDYICIKTTTGLGFSDITRNKTTNLVDSLQNGTISVESEHWSGYGHVIEPNSKFEELLIKFALMEGDVTLTSDTFSDFHPLNAYLNRLFTPLKSLKSFVPIVGDALCVFDLYCEPKFSVFFRYLNIGIELTIEGSGLVQYINNID